jgi:hypothetical protein
MVPPIATQSLGDQVVAQALLNGFSFSPNKPTLGPGKEYWNNQYGILIQEMDSGEVVFVFPIDENHQAVGQLLDNLLVNVYGDSIDSWVADNMIAAMKTPQSDTIGDLALYMEYFKAKNGNPPTFVVSITP